jgi:hypothetical protein
MYNNNPKYAGALNDKSWAFISAMFSLSRDLTFTIFIITTTTNIKLYLFYSNFKKYNPGIALNMY